MLKLTDDQLTKRLKRLGNLEAFRLYEAMKCLRANCALGAIVMAVSAVEHRLHMLLQRLDSRTYRRSFAKATLGGIIALFRTDSPYKGRAFDRLRKFLPEKHRPLMEVLNIYRIFSAHPKDEIITYQTARAILAFSFLLLMDETLTT